jgi:hypothetical protein
MKTMTIKNAQVRSITSKSLVDIGPPTGESFVGVLGSSNKDDTYYFRIQRRSAFRLKLSGLTANLEVELKARDNQLIRRSKRSGSMPESIRISLERGIYFVRVYRLEGESAYSLQMQSKKLPRSDINPPPDIDLLPEVGGTGKTTILEGSVTSKFDGYGGVYDNVVGIGGNRVNMKGASTYVEFKPSSIKVDAPIYSNGIGTNPIQDLDAAYKSDLRTGVFSLGTLTFFNGDESKGTPGSEGYTDDYGLPVGLSFQYEFTLNSPIKTKISGGRSFQFSATSNRPNNGSTADIINFPGVYTDFISLPSSPILFQALGMRMKKPGGGHERVVSAVNVPEGQTREFELFGRLVMDRDKILDGGTTPYPSYKREVTANKFWSLDGTLQNRIGAMTATFVPNYDLTLEAAAKLSGYKRFDWYQRIIYSSAFPERLIPFSDPKKGSTIREASNKDKKYWDLPYGKSWQDELPYYYIPYKPIPLPPDWEETLWLDHNIESESWFGWSPISKINKNLRDLRRKVDNKSLRFFDYAKTPDHVPSSPEKGVKLIDTAVVQVPRKSSVFETFLVGVDKEDELKFDALWGFAWYSTRNVEENALLGFKYGTAGLLKVFSSTKSFYKSSSLVPDFNEFKKPQE